MKNAASALAIIGIVCIVLGIIAKLIPIPAVNVLQLKQAVSYFTLGNTLLILSLVVTSVFKK